MERVSNQGDVHRVERRSAPVPGASDFNSRWDIYYSEEPTFGKRWQQICEQTKIEKLIGKGGVNIQSDGDTATLRWGGGFEEWGITITAERIEIGLDPNHAEIRLADDIVLFDGD